MGKIIDLPYLDRPREKALRYGIEKLSDYELIALLISSGTKEESATDIAYTMISQNNGLINVINKPLNDLLSFKGIGKAKAIKVSTLITKQKYQERRFAIKVKEQVCRLLSPLL